MIKNENNFKNDRNFYDGVGEISEGDVIVAIDNETVEILLGQHEKKFEKIDDRVTKLEDTTTKILINNAEMSVKLSNIQTSNEEIKKNIIENSISQQNFQKELIEKMLDNNTKVETTKIEGKSKFRTQTIITIGAVITTLISSGVAIYTVMHQVVK